MSNSGKFQGPFADKFSGFKPFFEISRQIREDWKKFVSNQDEQAVRVICKINLTKKIMTPAQIKYELEKAGYTQVRVADEFGVSQPSVNLVIHNKGTSHGLRCFIAKIIGRDVTELWDIKTNPTKAGRPDSRVRQHAAA
jgi:predicted XRE-type DNA-binding protein